MFQRMRAVIRMAPIALSAAFMLSGCSGGADSGQVPPSDNLTVSSAGGSFSLPNAAGYSGTMVYPAPSSGGGARAAIQANATQPGSTGSLPGGVSPTYYFGLYVAATVVFPTSPSFTIQLPSAAGAGPYYLAVFDTQNAGAGWNATAFGPASISGSTLTFASTGAQMTVNSGDILWFALY